MRHIYRISPSNKIVIEWKLEQEGARWCFFKVCDSPAHAKQTLAVLQGNLVDSQTERGINGEYPDG